MTLYAPQYDEPSSVAIPTHNHVESYNVILEDGLAWAIDVTHALSRSGMMEWTHSSCTYAGMAQSSAPKPAVVQRSQSLFVMTLSCAPTASSWDKGGSKGGGEGWTAKSALFVNRTAR